MGFQNIINIRESRQCTSYSIGITPSTVYSYPFRRNNFSYKIIDPYILKDGFIPNGLHVSRICSIYSKNPCNV